MYRRAVGDRVPSIFLLVPGPWTSTRELVDKLARQGVEAQPRGDRLEPGGVYAELVEDDDFSPGFTWGRRGRLGDDVVAAVAGCRTAALIEVAERLDRCASQVAQVGQALRGLGGVAVRMEGSGAASAWDPWLEQTASGQPWDLYQCAVIVVQGEGGFFTCGMQQFDLPDAQIQIDDPRQAVHWLDTFCAYQVAEEPTLASGHTFQPDAESSRRALERWPDAVHHPEDGRHNPFGVWRFLSEGETRLEASELVPTIIPPLVVSLAAAENAKGGPLTKGEVTTLVDKAPAIAMSIPDARALERGRGYADIEPELAWEQWQVVRATL